MAESTIRLQSSTSETSAVTVTASGEPISRHISATSRRLFPLLAAITSHAPLLAYSYACQLLHKLHEVLRNYSLCFFFLSDRKTKQNNECISYSDIYISFFLKKNHLLSTDSGDQLIIMPDFIPRESQ